MTKPTISDKTDPQPIVVWHDNLIDTDARKRLNGHRGGVLWFTGLSGSGKSTIANKVDELLYARRCHTTVLDGDNIRHGLCATPNQLSSDFGSAFAQRFGLGFGTEDRQENIRRVGAVCELMVSAGLVVLTAFISPYRADRDRVRRMVESKNGPGCFLEIFVDVPIEVCEQRDPKGLYKKARAGEIKNFTGIDDPYEIPLSPEIIVKNSESSVDRVAAQVVLELERRGWFVPS